MSYPTLGDIHVLFTEFPDGPELLLRAIHEEGVSDE